MQLIIHGYDMKKYIASYYIEKLHRYCYDVIYLQNHKPTRKDGLILFFLAVCEWIIPDYRQYLRKWHEDRKTYYLRYTPYSEVHKVRQAEK